MESLTTTVPGHPSAGPAATQRAVVLHDLDHLVEAMAGRLAAEPPAGVFTLGTYEAVRAAASAIASELRTPDLGPAAELPLIERAERAITSFREAISTLDGFDLTLERLSDLESQAAQGVRYDGYWCEEHLFGVSAGPWDEDADDAIREHEREHWQAAEASAAAAPSAATSPLEEWVLRILTAHPLSTADVIAALTAAGESDAETEVREALQRLAATGRIAERTITAWAVTP